ncbi:hypothetical protein DSM106972_052810 [Dulcicalothrix desertica PCC 7102]|uniref:Uncharacterized protein n=1 Tax=Dulcicalothrix desertica PCC 7102 TaxID=232991 RepID=A0A433VC11_9CYAN|nr:hypothetical protein [Dulcicalothrix desertica]RUT03642.1 hypothetical protein DSM106972_052810 [Dulcicalothrix desertica PCC 7102]TWH43918.1 hypothetical protein CAL7102_07670 [Dulcicalothrix desertica PCC 7102]
MTNKRERFPEGDTDRVSFTLTKSVRQRIDKLLPILGSSLSKTLRYVIDLGLDVFDLAQKSGNLIPKAGSLDKMFSTYTTLGVEFVFACESLGLSVPEAGCVGIWFVDNLYPGLDNVEGIQRDTNFQASRIFRLSREIQKLFYQELNLISEEEFTVFLRDLHSTTVIGQELVATCQALGLQPPEKGKLIEWLQDRVKKREASNFIALDSASGNLQPFLDYLFTLSAPPTEDEEHKIADQFGLEPAHLKRLISRMKFDDGN